MSYVHLSTRLSSVFSSNGLFSNTGLPLFFVASILCIAIFVAETQLTQGDENVKNITLTVNPEEDYESNHGPVADFQFNTTVANKTSKNPYMGLILDGITNRKFNGDVRSTLKSLGVPEEQVSSAYVSYYYLLVKQKRYDTVIDDLDDINQQQRLKNSVQFYYALALSRKAMYKKSLAQYKALINNNKNHQSATLNSAIVLQKMHRYQDAILYFTRAMEITSGTRKAKALAGIAHCNKQLGNHKEAIAFYQKSIEYRPADKVTWRHLGDAMAASNLPYETVIKTYNKAIALDPNYLPATESKAQYQLQQMDYYGALSTLAAHKKGGVKSYKSQMVKTWAYLELGKYSRSLRSIKKLADYKSNSGNVAQEIVDIQNFLNEKYLNFDQENWRLLPPETLYLYALANGRQRNYPLALEQLEILRQQPTFSARAKIAKARIYKSTKRYQEATKIYQFALANYPHSSTLWYESSKVQFKLRNHRLALSQIQLALEKQPNNKWYQLFQSDYLMALKQYDKATALLEKVHEAHPRSFKTLQRLVTALIATDKKTSIEGYLTKMLALNPDDVKTLMALADIQYQQGLYAESESTLNNLLQVQQNHLKARFLLANVSLKQGNTKKSLAHLSQLLKLKGNYRPAIKLRDKLLSEKSANKAAFSQFLSTISRV